jgi:hypothetical protein
MTTSTVNIAVHGYSCSSCDRFQTCSASVCPLEHGWKKRKHLKGERICYYLLEAQKDGAKANFEGAGKDKLYELIVSLTPAIISSNSTLKNAVEKANQSGSRMTRKFGCNHE